MNKTKTQLKWKLVKGADYIDCNTILQVNRRTFFEFYIELAEASANRVEVRRSIWVGYEAIPIFEETKTHKGKIADFTHELRGLEWNLLFELSRYLDKSTRKVRELMYPKNEERP